MNNNKIKAILFDMDGVIVDSEPLHFEAHKKALETFGIVLSKEEYLEHGVSSGRVLYSYMQEKYGKQIDVEKIQELKKKFYGELIEDKMEIFDGVKEKLEKLADKYILALVSNTHLDYIHRTLQKVGIEKFFKAFSSGKDLPREKPFPDVYLDSMKKLGFKKEECVAIEDSKNGIAAAKDAGIKCIAIPNDYTKHQDLPRADVILSSIKEIDEKLINHL